MSISFSGWVIIINGDGGCRWYTGGLTAQVRWLDLRVDGRLCAVLQLIKWTEWTLAMACGHDDSTINIVLVLLFLLPTQIRQKIIVIVISSAVSAEELARGVYCGGDYVRGTRRAGDRWRSSCAESTPTCVARHRIIANRRRRPVGLPPAAAIWVCETKLKFCGGGGGDGVGSQVQRP